MMKNGKLITEWLDYCERMMALIHTPTVAAQEEVHEWITSGRDIELWQALLNDGWTIAELDDAYARRTGFRMQRPVV